MKKDTTNPIDEEKLSSEIKSNVANSMEKQEPDVNTASNNKKEKSEPPKTLLEFVVGIYEGQKINREWLKALDRFDVANKDEHRVEILSIAAEKDPDFKITLSLAMAVLEGSMHAQSHAALLSYIENIISTIGSSGNSSTNTIFETWLASCRGVSDTAAHFFDRIERIKDTEGKQLPDRRRHNVELIALIWLYYKQELSFDDFILFYNQRILSLKGESGSHIEHTALAFLVSMATSTKKTGFAYFLSRIIEDKKKAEIELRQKRQAMDHLEQRLSEAGTKNKTMSESIETLEGAISEKVAELKTSKSELKELEKKARHATIHQKDDKEDLRMRYIKFLEGNLVDLLNNAMVANSRETPKKDIVAYKLEEAVRKIDRELTWLKK